MPDRHNAPDTILAALPECHTWSDRPDAEALKPLPNTPAVYLLCDEQGSPVQLATTQALRRLLTARLTDAKAAQPGKADLAAITRGVRWRPLHTPFEGRWWYYRLARALYPRQYRKLVSFGPAHFLHVDWTAAIPEIRTTDRIWRLAGEFLGPFPSGKAAQDALETLWDLFDLCRYPEQVRKTPHGSRCAYAEMGRCDAPCDGSAPLPRYVARCHAAWSFAGGGQQAWIATAENRMRSAAAEQQFEVAAQIKNQLAGARDWQKRWTGRVGSAESLNEALGLPVTRRKAWKWIMFRNGDLSDGPVVPDRRLTQDVPAWLAAQLAEVHSPAEPEVRMEQTWLWCHLLQRAEADAALRVPLPEPVVPPELPQRLSEALQERRSSRADTAEV